MTVSVNADSEDDIFNVSMTIVCGMNDNDIKFSNIADKDLKIKKDINYL